MQSPLVQGLVDALEAGDEFLGEGFAGLGPEQARGDAAVLLDEQGKGEELFDVLLDVELGLLSRGWSSSGKSSTQGVSRPKSMRRCRSVRIPRRRRRDRSRGCARCGVRSFQGCQGCGRRDRPDRNRGRSPGRAPARRRLGRVIQAAVGGVGFLQRPELPAHFELVGHVVVELLGGLGDGGFELGVGRAGMGSMGAGSNAAVGAGST